MIREVEYAPGNTGDLYLPDAPAPEAGYPAVLLIHGGAWTSMERSAMAGVAEFLCREGFAVFNIDYRLAPEDPWPRGFEDCKAALAYLAGPMAEKFPLDRKRVFVIGGSSGGHYALLTGLSAPAGSVAGIVSVSGIADVFPDHERNPGRYKGLFGFPPSREDLKKIDAREYYYDGAPPILCTHYLYDTVVPFDSARNFAAEVERRGGPVTLYGYDFGRRDQGHGIWIPGTSYDWGRRASEPAKGPYRELYPDLEQVILFFLRHV